MTTETLTTIRMTATTFDTETTAPDGSHRFTPGLVVAVGDRTGTIAPDTARRWIRIGIAEPFEGVPGTRISNEDVGKTADELDAEIENLMALRERARGGGRIVVQVPAFVQSDDPYHDPDAPHPFASLTERQRRSLELAGFTRPAHIERATDEEILEALGPAKGADAALAKLRGV